MMRLMVAAFEICAQPCLAGFPVVTTGAEALVSSNFSQLRGKRVGICSNPTGVLPSLEHIVDVMRSSTASDALVAIFGPEHGFRGDEQAGTKTMWAGRQGCPFFPWCFSTSFLLPLM